MITARTTTPPSPPRASTVLTAGIGLTLVAGVLTFAVRPSAAFARTVAPVSAVSPTPLPERTITISGKAVVRATPDRAEVRLGVVTTDANPGIAQQRNESSVKQMITAMRKVGVTPAQVSPGLFTLEQSSEEENDRKRTVFVVTTAVTVTLTDLSLVGAVLRSAFSSGATEGSVEFSTTKLRQYRDQARREAIKAAREKAMDMADAAGATVGPVRSFSEVSSGWHMRDIRANAVQNSSSTVDEPLPDGLGAQFGSGPISIEAEVAVEMAIR